MTAREAFYIASKWENKPNVARLAASLERMGHVISHKWFNVEAAYMEDSSLHARLDFHGVRDCSIFVALFDAEYPFRIFSNTYVELGMALALGKPVFIVGKEDSNCLFTWLEEPDASIERFDDSDSFLAFMGSRA